MPKPNSIDPEDLETYVDKIRYIESKGCDNLDFNDFEYSFMDSMSHKLEKLDNLARGEDLNDAMLKLSPKQKDCFDRIWDKRILLADNDSFGTGKERK